MADIVPATSTTPATVTTSTTVVGGRRRWPLLLIGASAGTATWSGWVGLGELTGFGVVHPLPGIWDDLTLNTAITLPIGVEAYAVYALAVATDPRPMTRLARRWAWTSAAGALLLGMAGQTAYHLLAAHGVTTAPAWVVALVSSLPVLVLGAASLLHHLAAAPVGDEYGREYEHGAGPDEASGVSVSATVSALPSRPRAAAVTPAGGVPEIAAAASTPSASDGQDVLTVPALSGAPDTPRTRAGRPAAAGDFRSDRARVTARLESPSDAEILAAAACGPDGEPPSIRALMRTYAIGQKRATRLHHQAREDQNTTTDRNRNDDSTTRNHDTEKTETTQEEDSEESTTKITNESPDSKIN